MIKIGAGLQVETITHPIIGQLHHAHCSGVVAWENGEILVVYYHAIKEANHKQAIYGVRKFPGKDVWSEPFLVSKDHPNIMEGNPSIWIAPDTRKLWLFYVSSFGGWSVCTPRYKTSDDRGHTWSKSTKIYWFISRGIKNPPILTSMGWYILPAYVEFRDYYAIFYISKDQGKSWRDSGARVGIRQDLIPIEKLPPKHQWERLVEQPTIIERKNGSIYCLNRAVRPLGKMYETESQNGGLTWSAAVPSILPNPGGGFHMLRLQSGNVAIIYNHSPAPPLNNFERNPVTIALSEDEGRTWKYRRNICEFHLEASDNTQQPRRAFGYPTMYQDPTGLIHATWSYSHPEIQDDQRYNFTDIQYTHFTEDWIKQKLFFESMFE
jgi:predicted neuraminidase